jgi:flagellar motor protein MotB
LENLEKIPFLDILIQRKINSLSFSVHRKPTDKGILLNFKSNSSFSTKSTVVRAGLRRAYE